LAPAEAVSGNLNPSTSLSDVVTRNPMVQALMSGVNAIRHPLDIASALGNQFVQGPQEAYQGAIEGDYNKMAHGVGTTIAVDFPAAYGAGQITKSLARTAGNAVTSPEALMLRAAENRAITQPNLAVDAVTALSPKAGIVRALSKPYRAIAAPLQEAGARFLAEGSQAPSFNIPTPEGFEVPTPQTPEITKPFSYTTPQQRITSALTNRPPLPSEPTTYGQIPGMTPEPSNIPRPQAPELGPSPISVFNPENRPPIQEAMAPDYFWERREPLNIPRPGPQEIPSAPSMPKPEAPDINRWMNVNVKQMVHGANPGQQIIEDGLLGDTKQATLSNVQTKLTDVGNQMGDILQKAGKQGVTINADDSVIGALDDATKTIGKRTDTGFQAQLSNILDDILHKHANLTNMSPQEFQTLKTEIGDAVTWGRGTAYEADVNQALVDIYRRLNSTLADKVSGISALQKQWGNLYQASKSLKISLLKDAIGRGTGAVMGGQ
jgi:hypothetical protein